MTTAGASAYRRTLAIAGIFTLMSGDTWRYMLTWWGWGAIVLILTVLGIIELVRSRIDLRRLPILLLATLALMALSIAWSNYRFESVIGVVATAVTTTFAVFLATCFTWDQIVDALVFTTRFILGVSLLFELYVEVFVGYPMLPFFVNYHSLPIIPAAFYWSQALLFDGGRIQGIQGNANLLAITALIALIVGFARSIAGRGNRLGLIFWSIVGVAVLLLTRSSTVLIATVAVGVVTLVAWFARRGSGRRRTITLVAFVPFLAAVVATAVAFREPLLDLLGKSDDLSHRLDIWASVANLAIEHPVAGWGWVSYWAPWVEPFRHLAVFNGVTYLQAHNAWLDIFLQLGIIGLVVMGLYVLTTIMRSWSYALDGPRANALLPLAIVTALLVQSLAESRLLIEIGWALLVIVSIRTATNRWARGDSGGAPITAPVATRSL